eukprot:m.681706 g.681706  ORF g.681706 m.681706 type:complete len:172 (+) comp22813_c0_seq4:2481-2996(+)
MSRRRSAEGARWSSRFSTVDTTAECVGKFSVAIARTHQSHFRDTRTNSVCVASVIARTVDSQPAIGQRQRDLWRCMTTTPTHSSLRRVAVPSGQAGSRTVQSVLEHLLFDATKMALAVADRHRYCRVCSGVCNTCGRTHLACAVLDHVCVWQPLPPTPISKLLQYARVQSA